MPGATVASLSIPWGNTRNDLGRLPPGLVARPRRVGRGVRRARAPWRQPDARSPTSSRRRSRTATGPRTSGSTASPYWTGLQLDEAAYPILLAGALRTGASHMHGKIGRHEAAAFENLVSPIGARPHDRARRRVHRQDRSGHESGPLGGDRRALTPSTLAPVVAALVVAAGPPARAGRLLLPRARRRLERLDRGLDVRPRHPARPGARGRRPLRPDRLAGRARRGADLDAGHAPQSPPRRVDGGGRRDGRHGLPGARPVRAPPAGRPADRVEPRRRRCRPANRHAERAGLAPLQRRRLRRARGRERLRRDR